MCESLKTENAYAICNDDNTLRGTSWGLPSNGDGDDTPGEADQELMKGDLESE